ncbi:flagellar basal body P-ring formation chaperone FlgA [Rickettsiales bacterium]|nr:flagellar basal body P-ring formation chaperone FlgA [Rickettsiales bacterium]
MIRKLIVLIVISIFPIQSNCENIDGVELQKLAEDWLLTNDIPSNIKILPEIKYPSCEDILINSIARNHSLIKLTCSSPNKWSFIIRNKVLKTEIKKTKEVNSSQIREIDVLVLKNNLNKGKIIKKNNIELSKKKIRNMNNIVTDISELIGKKTKKRIMAGRAIDYRFLEKDWLMEKDTEIMIENTVGPVTIKLKGISLEDADYMGKVKVKNISSGEVLTGYVENKKKVLIKPKQF